MEVLKLSIIFALIAAVIAENDIEKDKISMAMKKGQSRSALPEPVRGSFQKLSNLMNRSEEFKNRRRGKQHISKLLQLGPKNAHENMMNDNEGAVSSQKSTNENDTNSLTKIKALRPTLQTYEATYKNPYIPQISGVFCSFEQLNASDMCMWQWNQTTSSHGLGFKVVTAADVEQMNQSTHGLKFSAPTMDADFRKDGHFLYLPVDPTMENMVIKSPPFRGLREFCKFEVKMHQSKMQNASIRLVSESTLSEVQWILQEFAGNNVEMWQPMRFMIGKVQQEVRIIIEITRPNHVSVSQVLPHIAVDNIRMVECLPEPPVFNGECQFRQLKCKIMKKDSCIKTQQVCDLVKDCDDGYDEHQNCVKMPYGSYCNFEHDTCGFENVPQPILKWSRHSGPTPTDKTGPNYDHTCGPPQMLYTTINPIIPLAPPHRNYSVSACVGYYFFVNMNVTGPNKERADFASTAVMKTVIFNPPPKVHGNITSKYYNCCTIRFYYQQNGRNYGSLSVDVVELTSRGNITTSLWFSTKDKGENWYRAAIFLPNITSRYYFLFKTRMGMRIYSDSAIDDFSMAPECFGLNINATELGDYNYYDPVFEEKTTPHPDFADTTSYRFTTCGVTGRLGPNQTLCDAAYKNTSVSVTVVNSPPYTGIQVWEVPNEGLYTIIATGASGGLGSMWAGVSHGAQARGLFELHRAEKIYMLIGQQGLNACKKTLSAQESQECSRRESNDTYQNQIFTSKTHEVRNTHVNDGGGGGGGGTFVFLLGKNGRPIPLLVGGGGGGISVGVFRDDNSQHARGRTNATPESGYMYGTPGRTSGAGGGWLSRRGPITPGFELVRGSALQDGGSGGLACNGGAHGGFGGGGGGCLRGGGGGGWAGGSTHDGVGQHGEGGWSYIDNTRAIKDFSSAGVALRTGPGEVLIIPAIHACGCNYRCVAMNEYRSDVKCYCPASWTSDVNDPTKCILEEAWSQGWWILIIVLCVIGLVCMVTVPCICLHLYNKYQRKKEAELQQKRLLEQEVQLHRLRSAPGGGENALGMAFNPYYGSENFFPTGIDVKGLPQVTRDKLKLIKALGQGAFGEVYQGLYKHQPGDTVEMPVAVKTLPELSTGQAESDFLMEAAIMAKFNHPNIVHIIGVCFDRHPRFLVLELLGGGDLKQFLRDNRPKPDRASALTMKDLILCSLDICKGCKYLESQRFIHRDIAARNCLLTSRGPGRVCKIADFGMARDIYRADYYRKGGKAMLPIKWMPPEAYIDGVFTAKTDVWSFGVLLWEVFSLGVMPYTGCSNREVMQLVSGGGRLDKPYGCPPDVYRLMCECWNPNPDERPTFAQMFDRLQRFLQDPEITSAPLPMMRSLIPLHHDYFDNINGVSRSSACDYLIPMSPQEQTPDDSSTEPLAPHSKTPTATTASPGTEASPFPPLLKASQEYGNIPTASKGAGSAMAEGFTASGAETRTSTKFLPSNSTDRLLSSIEVASLDEDSETEADDKPIIWETSFIETNKHAGEPKPTIEPGPTVEKLISITPTSPKPPENVLSKAIDSKTPEKRKIIPDKSKLVSDKNKLNADKNKLNVDKKLLSADKLSVDINLLVPDKNKNTLGVEKKAAPIASPDPPRINAWAAEPQKVIPKPKPLCLDAAQLEQNLNALKKNSGSVNLTTMNIVPPYINVVTPNKLSESKTIQIDPKKAVIHDLPAVTENDDKNKLKQSSSAASLLNGPLTDVPYADSDNTSSGSGSMGGNARNKSYPDINNINGKSKVKKQGSEGDKVADLEISC